MVSWGRAFRGAAAIIGFAIIWWIIGMALAVAGAYITGGLGFFGAARSASFVGVGIGAILIFIGCVISILGTFAAFLKVLPERVAEEVHEK